MSLIQRGNAALSNLPVRHKLNVLTGLIALGVIALSVVAARMQYLDLYQTRIAAITAHVEAGNTVLAHYAGLAEQGQMSTQQAQTAAVETLASMRAPSSGMYYTVLGLDDDSIVMHPFRRERAGSPLSGYLDEYGVAYNSLLAEAARNGGGQVHYHARLPEQDNPVVRIAHAERFAPWNWAVTTGAYVGDVQQQAMAFTWVMTATGGTLVLLVFALAWLIGSRITVPLRKATAVADAIAHGRLDNDTRAEGNDEAGQLLDSMGQMQQRLHAVIRATRQLASDHAQGLVSRRIDTGPLPGEYALMAEEVNTLAAQHVDTAGQLATLVQAYAQGDLRQDMPQLPGEQAALSQAMATVKQNLQAISQAITSLSAAAAAGDFSQRQDSARFTHGFAEMVEQLNTLMATTDSGLDAVSAVLRGIADGDLTVRMAGRHQGVFARIQTDANTSVDNLAGIVGRIHQASLRIDQAAGEIASANADLSQRTEQQAANLEETAASMEELTATVQLNASHAQQADRLAAQAAGVADQAGNEVAQAVTTMAALEQSSRRIADIISVIDGIAFQTNILALNAAVEAARAGEQGRGFAVVASEVRTLAQRSAAAAKEIKTLIDDSVTQVGQGVAEVNRAGGTMGSVVDSVQRVTALMAQISEASSEQGSGIAQVSQTVMQMDQSTQQNAAMVEEASAAAHAMRSQSRSLLDAVAAFRLDSTQR